MPRFMTKSDETCLLYCFDGSVMRRFLALTASVEGGCIEWIGARRRDLMRYGYFRINDSTIPAHRLAFVIHHKRLPVGGCVRHKCDNPICVNPDHLDEGTHADNTRDRDTRGRQRSISGMSNSRSKLTDSEVLTIREMYSSKRITHRALAVEFRVSKGLIQRVLVRHTRPNLDPM